MKLADVLKGFPEKSLAHLSERDLGQQVASVTSDSREVVAGSVFVAVRGGARDGHEFIAQAQQSGALLVIGEEPLAAARPLVPYLRTSSSRLALARVAANFHGNPSHSMTVVGVTGTSGKTTTTYLLESIFRAAGRRVGVIGTVNFRFGERVFPSTHTTPGAVEMQRLLAQMKAEGCDTVVMEVSSHALKQQRVAFIAWDAVVFTNLSPEHLDFHADMEDYFRSKAILFTGAMRTSIDAGKRPVAVVNADDSYGERLVRELNSRSDSRLRLLAFGVGEGDFKIDLEGIRGEISGVQVRSPLTGTFNGYNVMGAIAVGIGLNLSRQAIAEGIANLRFVPGRLQPVPNDQGIHVLVDYAHKPDALDKVLRTLSEVRGEHRLITVFGCGGDRDRTKRPVMGKLAVENSTHVFITSDNPRTEEPQAIIDEILQGTKGHTNLTIVPDRRQAIHQAIRLASKGDLVLIAGKGHEDYQIIGDDRGGTRKVHFDDREVAAQALRARRG